MIKSSLIEAVRTFSPKEMKELGEFVNSPFYNKNENVIKLFDVIRKAYPEFEESKIEKTKVFRKIFHSKPYKDSTMRLLMYYLSEAVEKYLAISRFSRNEFGFKRSLASEFYERDLIKDYEKVINAHKNHLEKVKYKDEDYYMNNFIYLEENLNFLYLKYQGKYEKFLTKENLESVTNNLTYYYLLRVFKFYTVSLNTMSLYNIEIDTALFQNLLVNFDESSFSSMPLIDIYYHIILSFMEPDEEKHYFRIKELIVNNNDAIDRASQIDIFINLENYCHRKYRVGENKFLNESLQIYRLELERSLHLDRGYMSSQFYTSAVVTGCRLEEFEWVREFIEKYKKDLKKEWREPMYYYGLAFLENHTKNYEKALEHLAKVKADELYLKMDMRLLQCRIYYSLVWNMPLQSLLDTFKKTVHNNKHMKENRKEQFLKFIKYLNQLNNMRYKKDSTGLRELGSELEKEDYFPYKIWLSEEIDKVMKDN